MATTLILDDESGTHVEVGLALNASIGAIAGSECRSPSRQKRGGNSDTRKDHHRVESFRVSSCCVQCVQQSVIVGQIQDE
jgi:hypothetical protein